MTIERYCVANKLRCHLTLTFATGPSDRTAVKKHASAFLSRLRSLVNGHRFPFAYVISRGDGGRLHVHVALPPGIEHWPFETLWPHGHVGAKVLGNIDRERWASKKLATYLAKNFPIDDVKPGERLYSVASGFTPPAIKYGTRTLREGLERAAVLGGGPVDLSWSRAPGQEGWSGPPVVGGEIDELPLHQRISFVVVKLRDGTQRRVPLLGGECGANVVERLDAELISAHNVPECEGGTTCTHRVTVDPGFPRLVAPHI